MQQATQLNPLFVIRHYTRGNIISIKNALNAIGYTIPRHISINQLLGRMPRRDLQRLIAHITQN